MTAEQDLAIADSIRMENQKRQAAGQPPMSAQEIARYRSMKSADIADTAATQDRLLQTQGAVKTTMRGAQLTSGPYKGMDPAQAKAAAISGAAPPGKYAPGRMGSVRGSLTGDSLYGPQPAPSTPTAAPPPAPTPAPAPAATAAPPAVRNIDPMFQEKRGFDAMPSAAPSAAPQPRKPGLIDGKPSNVWFQEAANRQGMANSYGTVQPQAPAAPAPAPAPTAAPPAVRPIDPMLKEPRGFSAPVAAPTAAAPPLAPKSAAPSPMLSTSAPKMLKAPTDGNSAVGAAMMNSLRIRPGFDKIAAGVKQPMPIAAIPKTNSRPSAATPALVMR